MENLADIAVFVQVVEAGSFTAAAEQIGVSKAVISKYVSRLEQRLGARLLQRTTRRLTLTEAGEALFQRGAGALAVLEQAEQEVARLTGAPRGRLRVTAPTYFGGSTLAPLLKDFIKRYPEITLELDLDDRITDLVRDRFDVAVRISNSVDPGLVARKLASSALVAVAAPGYFKRRGTPRAPGDLHEHACLGYSLAKVAERMALSRTQGALDRGHRHGPHLLQQRLRAQAGSARRPRHGAVAAFLHRARARRRPAGPGFAEVRNTVAFDQRGVCLPAQSAAEGAGLRRFPRRAPAGARILSGQSP